MVLTDTVTVGNDIREAVLDGFPAAQTIGCDLRPGEFAYSPTHD
jgi:hypothetical protein